MSSDPWHGWVDLAAASDFKGYRLGMSIEEIDRLHKFREQGKFVNSIKRFQEITQVSDSLLNIIAPYFLISHQQIEKIQEI